MQFYVSRMRESSDLLHRLRGFALPLPGDVRVFRFIEYRDQPKGRNRMRERHGCQALSRIDQFENISRVHIRLSA